MPKITNLITKFNNINIFSITKYTNIINNKYESSETLNFIAEKSNNLNNIMKNNNKSSYVYVFLYKYHCVFCVMILIISFLIMVLVVVVSIHVLSLATESIFLALVKYYYVEGMSIIIEYISVHL